MLLTPEEFSQHANARSLDRVVEDIANNRQMKLKGKNLSLSRDTNGYPRVSLGKSNMKRIHILVCEAFIGPRPLGMQIRHLDGNPSNNYIDNLCYGTATENMQDTLRHGTATIGTKNGMAVLTVEQVTEIRNLKGRLSCSKLGKKFSVCPQTINDIHTGKRWKHVK